MTSRTKNHRPRLLPHERHAVAVARSLKLWLLFDGTPDHRVWRVYAMPAGKPLGTYVHHTFRFTFAGRTGQASGWRNALEIAAGCCRGGVGGAGE